MKTKYIFLILFSLIIFFILLTSSFTMAQSNKTVCQTTLEKIIKEQGQTQENWSETEQFVWNELCQKNIEEADLLKFSNKPEDRILSLDFLRAILLQDKYNRLLPKKIKIRYAVFEDKIDLASEKIEREVSLFDSEFHKEIDLSNSIFLRSLYFDGSKFYQDINLNGATIEGSLSFNGSRFGDKYVKQCYKNNQSNKGDDDDNYIGGDDNIVVDLQGIKIKGNLFLEQLIFSCFNRSTSSGSDEEEDQEIYFVDLKAASIKISVILQGISLDINPHLNGSVQICARKGV